MIGVLASSKVKLKAISFGAGGSYQYLTVASHAAIDFELTDPFTVLCRVRDDAPAPRFLAGKIEPDVCGWWLGLTDDGRVAFYVAATDDINSGGASQDWIHCAANGGPISNDDLWHTVAATYDGSQTHAGIKLYTDGTAHAKTNTGGPIVGATMQSGAPLSWSKPVTGLGGDSADLAIYNRVLSPAEIVIVSASAWPDLTKAGPFADLVGYWRPTVFDAVPTIADLSSSAHDATGFGALATDQAKLFSR